MCFELLKYSLDTEFPLLGISYFSLSFLQAGPATASMAMSSKTLLHVQ